LQRTSGSDSNGFDLRALQASPSVGSAGKRSTGPFSTSASPSHARARSLLLLRSVVHRTTATSHARYYMKKHPQSGCFFMIKDCYFNKKKRVSLNFITLDYCELYALKSWHFGNAFLNFSTTSLFMLRRRTHELSHGTISIVARGC